MSAFKPKKKVVAPVSKGDISSSAAPEKADNVSADPSAAPVKSQPTKRVIPEVELPKLNTYTPDTNTEPTAPAIKRMHNDDKFMQDFTGYTPEEKSLTKAAEKAAADKAKNGKKKSNGVLIAVVVILVLAAAGVSAYFTLFTGNNDTSTDVIETTSPPTATETVTETAVSEETVSETSADEISETEAVSETTAAESESISEETEAETSVTSEETTVEETAVNAVSDAELKNISLTFTHQQSQGRNVIASYDTAGAFSPSMMSADSMISVDYNTPVTLAENMFPVTIVITDGTNSVEVAAASKTDNQIFFNFATFEAAASAAGISLDSITNISFYDAGMPVDITAIVVTLCSVDESAQNGFTIM